MSLFLSVRYFASKLLTGGNWLRVEARNYRFRVERDKASCSKAYSYIVRCNGDVECLYKRVEKVLLRNVGNLHPHHVLDLLAVRTLERTGNTQHREAEESEMDGEAYRVEQCCWPCRNLRSRLSGGFRGRRG
jgi:hypothetical protein